MCDIYAGSIVSIQFPIASLGVVGKTAISDANGARNLSKGISKDDVVAFRRREAVEIIYPRRYQSLKKARCRRAFRSFAHDIAQWLRASRRRSH